MKILNKIFGELSKINKILLIIVAALLIALGAVLYWQKVGFEKPYWAVYLNTGDLYFGKISYFPRLSLSDVYLFQRTNDEKNPFSISKFENAFWGPVGRIYLNDENIVWKAELRKDSQILEFIKNSSNVQQVQ